MKSLFTILFLVGSFADVASAGPTISGGIPPAPRAVVLQGHLGPSGFDLVGREMALHLAATHIINERVLALTQRPEAQYKDRTYICIEYKTNDDAQVASAEFKDLLTHHTSIEVVWNGTCK